MSGGGGASMSCNGCRVLRKGCSETCVLRQCLRLIEGGEAQGHATLFVAKFFGRAGLMSSVSAVPESQRPALFRSLLFEAAGRTISPVDGAVGLLWTGNWHLCQAAVETVLRGGAPRPLSHGEYYYAQGNGAYDDAGAGGRLSPLQQQQQPAVKRRRASPPALVDDYGGAPPDPSDLGLCLTSLAPERERRPGTPSEESVTTCTESCGTATRAAPRHHHHRQDICDPPPTLLNLFL